MPMEHAPSTYVGFMTYVHRYGIEAYSAMRGAQCSIGILLSVPNREELVKKGPL